MPESGAVERIREAMDAWLHKGLPADFDQLRTDLAHVLDCIPPTRAPDGRRYEWEQWGAHGTDGYTAVRLLADGKETYLKRFETSSDADGNPQATVTFTLEREYIPDE